MAEGFLSLRPPAEYTVRTLGRALPVGRLSLNGGALSHGAALLLDAADEEVGSHWALPAELRDSRQSSTLRHTHRDLVRHQVFSPTLGNADANGTSRLADDRMHKVRLERAPLPISLIRLQAERLRLVGLKSDAHLHGRVRRVVLHPARSHP